MWNAQRLLQSCAKVSCSRLWTRVTYSGNLCIAAVPFDLQHFDAIHTKYPKSQVLKPALTLERKGHCKLCVAQRRLSVTRVGVTGEPRGKARAGKPQQGAEDEGAGQVRGTGSRASELRFPEAPRPGRSCWHCWISKWTWPASYNGRAYGRILTSAIYTQECSPVTQSIWSLLLPGIKGPSALPTRQPTHSRVGFTERRWVASQVSHLVFYSDVPQVTDIVKISVKFSGYS